MIHAIKSWLNSRRSLTIVLAIITGLYLVQNINLVAGDIGRHLRNGQTIWQDGLASPVLTKNFYSYTQPTFTYPNHHWLYGVIIWPVYQFFGSTGLILFNATLLVISLVLVMATTKTKHRSSLLFGWLICLPLIIWRTEVRPENFSLLLAALSLFLLNRFETNQLSGKLLVVAFGLIGIIWVNIHLFFPLGMFLVGFSVIKIWCDLPKANKTNHKLQSLMICLIIVCTSFLVNPNGRRGAVVPFTIFLHYPYPVAENQSTGFFLRYFSDKAIHWYFVIFALVNLVLLNPKKSLASVPSVIWWMGLIIGGAMIVKLYPMVGILSLPTLINRLDKIIDTYQNKIRYLATIPMFWVFASPTLLILFLAATASRLWLPNFANIGLNFQPNSLTGGEFLRQIPKDARIFNNYDVGGYLIFTNPQLPIFVDNRPEFYSTEFIKDVYIKAQQDDQTWQEISSQYRLDWIFFYRHDATSWGQPFLVARLQDPDWTPVYVDNYFIAFAKITTANTGLIAKYQLPKEMFTVRN